MKTTGSSPTITAPIRPKAVPPIPPPTAAPPIAPRIIVCNSPVIVVDLRGGEIEQLAIPRDMAARRVKQEGAPAHHRRFHPSGATLQGADPVDQLAKVEWFDQVVVGSRIQALDAIGRRVASRQHQN